VCVAQQRVLVQASAEGSVQARCQALGLARSSYYYQPRGESAENLLLALVKSLAQRLIGELVNCHILHENKYS